MSDGVKNSGYSSPLRQAQARATRRAIVDAAARLFVERGYGGTTIDAVAEAAGVSRKTVFTSVGGKSQALRLAIDWAIVGDDEPVPMLERPHVKQAQQEADAREVLRGYARANVGSATRVADLFAVLEQASGADSDLRALAEDMDTQRVTGMRALAGLLAERQALRPDLTVNEAADLLFVITSPGTYRTLVTLRGWRPERYEQWLADTLITLLLPKGYKPKR